MAAAELHPAASHNLPSFIAAPGETDVLMVVTAVILAVLIVMFGILFLRLHSLPEHMAIIEALEARDTELAEKRARDHTLGLAAYVEAHGQELFK